MTFQEAFERLNGRPPTTDEVKEALAIADITKQSDLDPVLLLFIGSARANDERKKMVADLRSIATDTVETVRAGLPTNPEWAQAASWAAWFAKAMKTEANWVIKWAIATAAAVALIVLVSIIVSWRSGYGAGYNDARDRGWYTATQRACTMLHAAQKKLDAQHSNAHAVRVQEKRNGCI